MKYVLRAEVITVVAICFVAIAATGAAADYIPPCQSVPADVSVISRLDDAPPSLVGALTARVGEIVPVGGRFDSTDVVWTGKNRRLIFIWNRGTRWVVATEHGGLGYNDPIFVFESDEQQNKVELVREEITFPPGVCLTALRLIAAAPSPSTPEAK